MSEIILPGTYIRVFDEGLISAGTISSGNIGIVGTSEKGPIETPVILSSFSEARAYFGEIGDWSPGATDNLSLVRSLELIFNNGGNTVYAVRVAASDAASAKLDLKKGTLKYLTLEAKTKGAFGNSISIEIIVTDSKPVLVASDTSTTEKFEFSTIRALVDLINNSSNLVNATFVKEPDSIENVALSKLEGGNSGATITSNEIKKGLEVLENDIINIIVLAGQDVNNADLLLSHIKKTTENKRERIGIIGAASDNEANHKIDNERIIVVAPGIKSKRVIPQTKREVTVDLPAPYAAAAIAGLISSLQVQASPTNKTLAIGGLTKIYNTGSLEKLVQSRVLTIEQREGYRVVKGITSATNSAWHQITTRRIVDYAIYGVRSACNPYIGKLNNERVRGAMKATLDSFLTRMVNDEALIGYQLEVTSTRAEQIEGVVKVMMTLQPTFSIDYIVVNMYLG